MTQPNSPDQDRIGDLEQKPVDGGEAENVKGGGSAVREPTLIRVPGPTAKKVDPCYIPCI